MVKDVKCIQGNEEATQYAENKSGDHSVVHVGFVPTSQIMPVLLVGKLAKVHKGNLSAVVFQNDQIMFRELKGIVGRKLISTL